MKETAKRTWSRRSLMCALLCGCLSSCRFQNDDNDLSASIAGLASTQFAVVRKAQREIALHGTNAIPALEAVLRDSHHAQQKGLALYMVGEIAPTRYVRFLCEARGPQEIEVASMYVNATALSVVDQDKSRELKEHLRSLESELAPSQAADLHRILSALPSR